MTQLALSSATSDNEEPLQQAVYPSPGGCDEFVSIFVWQKRIPREQMKDWQGKLTGLRDHGKRITLMLCSLEKFGGKEEGTRRFWLGGRSIRV